MAEKVKDYYSVDYARDLAEKLSAAWPGFPSGQFVGRIDGYVDDLAFMQRMDLFADALEECIPLPYPQVLDIFTRVLGPVLVQETGMFTEGWWLWPVGRYVERHAVEDVEASLTFLEELTQRHTGEYAIRPLLAAYPAQTLVRMQVWSTHESVHVRRLASEGIRIRLPWAKKLDLTQAYAGEVMAILSNLRHDPSKFVQKSVGNNLNDLYKENPAMAAAIIDAWLAAEPSAATFWIINHGQRGQRKKETKPAQQ